MELCFGSRGFLRRDLFDSTLVHFGLSQSSSMFNVPITADCKHPTTLCLFAHAALPLHSPQARNIHHALGNCFFPPPLKSHHFTRLRASVLLFIFKGLNQDKYSQVNSRRRAALCGPQKWPENLLSRYKIVSVAQRSRKNVDGFWEKGGRVLVVVGPARVLPRVRLCSRDHSALVSSSALQRLGGEALWNHTITASITTLSKHNWADLDRWEREEEGMEFHCWYKERREHIVLASVCWKHRRHTIFSPTDVSC